jgi:hypothetical protein
LVLLVARDWWISPRTVPGQKSKYDRSITSVSYLPGGFLFDLGIADPPHTKGKVARDFHFMIIKKPKSQLTLQFANDGNIFISFYNEWMGKLLFANAVSFVFKIASSPPQLKQSE